MRMRGGNSHAERLRVLRAEPHCAGGSLDSDFRFAHERLRQSAEVPRPREVGVEIEGTIDQRHAVFEIAGDNHQGEAGIAERKRIVLPSSAARHARRRTSAISLALSLTQLKPTRCT